MRKSVLLLFLLLSFISLELKVLAQDEYPVIVRAPSVSVTVFTNWWRVKLTYTVGYMDGYQVLLDGSQGAQPQNMSFGLELDPEKGTKLEIVNRRKFKDENYFDLVYYLRYINEKKGDLSIPEQVFYYVKEEVGKPLEGLEVQNTKSPPAVLRYDSVLTKGANDIIDVIDFGSFKQKEKSWKFSMTVPIVVTVLVFFLLFFSPARTRTRAVAVNLKNGKPVDEAELLEKQRLVPKEAIAAFLESFEKRESLIAGNSNITPEATRAQMANDLKELLAAYVPEVINSDTPKEIQNKILVMEDVPEKNKLSELAAQLVYLDSVLCGQLPAQDINYNIAKLWCLGFELQTISSFWGRLSVKLKKQLQRIKLWIF